MLVRLQHLRSSIAEGVVHSPPPTWVPTEAAIYGLALPASGLGDQAGFRTVVDGWGSLSTRSPSAPLTYPPRRSVAGGNPVTGAIPDDPTVRLGTPVDTRHLLHPDRGVLCVSHSAVIWRQQIVDPAARRSPCRQQSNLLITRPDSASCAAFRRGAWRGRGRTWRPRAVPDISRAASSGDRELSITRHGLILDAQRC